jgi:hypothetical protein
MKKGEPDEHDPGELVAELAQSLSEAKSTRGKEIFLWLVFFAVVAVMATVIIIFSVFFLFPHCGAGGIIKTSMESDGHRARDKAYPVVMRT